MTCSPSVAIYVLHDIIANHVQLFYFLKLMHVLLYITLKCSNLDHLCFRNLLTGYVTRPLSLSMLTITHTITRYTKAPFY